MPVFKKSPPSGSVRVRTMRRRLLKVSQQDGLVPVFKKVHTSRIG